MTWRVLACLTACLLALGSCSAPRVLTVCADPNNMPFSNARREGLENRMAEVIARDLKAELRYVWWSQRRGFVRNTLGSERCDAWMGVPSTLETLATSRPYYRSTYVFVSRADAGLGGLTLDDPRLRSLRIGVQLAGDDGANPPPADSLARRGLIRQARGYMLYGDYRDPNPAADILRAVERREIDLALVWGPLAGWYARSSAVPLKLEPVQPWLDGGRWPQVFDISVGVAKADTGLRREIDTALARNKPIIAELLQRYNIPLVPGS